MTKFSDLNRKAFDPFTDKKDLVDELLTIAEIVKGPATLPFDAWKVSAQTEDGVDVEFLLPRGQRDADGTPTGRTSERDQRLSMASDLMRKERRAAKAFLRSIAFESKKLGRMSEVYELEFVDD